MQRGGGEGVIDCAKEGIKEAEGTRRDLLSSSPKRKGRDQLGGGASGKERKERIFFSI